MKRKMRFLSLMITLVLLIGTLGTAPVYAARESRVGYVIAGTENGGEFTLDIAISNVRAFAGRIAISFDTSKLQLKSDVAVPRTVTMEPCAEFTSEGLDKSVLLSNNDGHIMFAWYSSDNKAIDASNSDVKIASIAFTMNGGATVDDFTQNTLGLHYVNGTMVDNWDCSANIINYDLISYKNTAVTDETLCSVSFDYPNCDYLPPVTYRTLLRVSDENGSAVGAAEITLGSAQGITDQAGNVTFEMESGVYPYRVSADGYVAKSGYIIVNEAETSASIQMQSTEQFVRELAQQLSINFLGGDSADSVTTSMGFSKSGEYGEEIFWQSSNTDVVDDQGIVNRPEDDTNVTITAIVLYKGVAARRTFEITVKSRLTAEEKNAIIVQKDLEALQIAFAPGDSADAVTSSVTLAGMGANGSTIAWSSSNEEVMNAYGVLNRPDTDTEITLTAMVMRGTASRTKEFKVTVMGTSKGSSINETEIVETVLKALEIGYSGADTANSVTQQLKLPVLGVEDTIINWESSAPAVVTAYGGVVRQAKDCDVTLTATATNGAASAQKQFSLRVLAAPLTPVNPDNGQESEIKESNSNRKPTGSTNNPVNAPNEGEKAEGRGFTDLKNVPWAEEAIEALSKREVIKGTSAATFSPEEQIKRCDFVTLLMRLLNQKGEITGSEGFADVSPDAYYYEPVTLAKSLGLITGVGENRFDPDGNITRQDMLTMTYRALKKLEKANFKAADLSGFPDEADIAQYAYESVSKLVGAGYIKGDEQGRLNPEADTTRAETAVFLYRLGI